jgi:hypothetical protein
VTWAFPVVSRRCHKDQSPPTASAERAEPGWPLIVETSAGVPLNMSGAASARRRLGNRALRRASGAARLDTAERLALACASVTAFTRLARGLAVACQFGGITFAGTHWCTNHHACQQDENAQLMRA